LLIAAVALTLAPVSAASEDSRAKVVSVELHRSANGERIAFRLQVRNFRSGGGEFVHVSRGEFGEREAFARRVRGSYRRWRVGMGTKEGRELLNEVRETLESKGVVRVDAGVLASAPVGGKLSHFRIKAYNEAVPALGALPH
jgi:hypothetical protein